MVQPSGREKMFKHYMINSDFELDHHRDLSYPTIEPHYHEFYEILYFISGHVNYIIGDKFYHLQNGDLLIIPPSILHNPVFEDFSVPYERYVLWISCSTLEQLLSVDQELLECLSTPDTTHYLLRRNMTAWGNFRSIFTSLEDTMHKKKPLYRAQIKAFILHLMVEYNQALLAGSTSIQPGVRDNLLTNVLHYIRNHITDDLSLDTISREFIIDKYSLSHLFKEKMGISYYQYVLQQRLLLGKDLLLNGMPANKVCFCCGFNDYSSFFRAFRKEYEVSPTQFKKVHENITFYPASFQESGK
jgi:AraC-like DNA-binding protein